MVPKLKFCRTLRSEYIRLPSDCESYRHCNYNDSIPVMLSVIQRQNGHAFLYLSMIKPHSFFNIAQKIIFNVGEMGAHCDTGHMGTFAFLGVVL